MGEKEREEGEKKRKGGDPLWPGYDLLLLLDSLQLCHRSWRTQKTLQGEMLETVEISTPIKCRVSHSPTLCCCRYPVIVNFPHPQLFNHCIQSNLNSLLTIAM